VCVVCVGVGVGLRGGGLVGVHCHSKAGFEIKFEITILRFEITVFEVTVFEVKPSSHLLQSDNSTEKYG